MKKGSKVTKLIIKNLTMFIAILTIVSMAGTKVTNAEEYPIEVDDHIQMIEFDGSRYTLTDLLPSPIDYNNKGTLGNEFEMSSSGNYSVVYDDALTLPNGDTLDVKVDIKLVDRQVMSDGYTKIIFYQTEEPEDKDNTNKPRVYWYHAGDTTVQWTIELYKEYNPEEGIYTPNDTEILTGFVDPDESNYLFDGDNTKVYFKQPKDYNTAHKSIVDNGYGYSLTSQGLIKNSASKNNPGQSFTEAVFYVAITDEFTFTSKTFYNGELWVPYFYLPSYNVEYRKNSPTGNDDDVTGSIPDQINPYNISNDVVNNNTQSNGYKINGYKFVGWNTLAEPSETTPGKEFDPEGTSKSYNVPNYYDDNNTFEEIVSINETVPLYAQWEPVYNVVYDSNGGTGETPAQNGIDFKEEETTVSPNGFTRDGYVFVGWNTSADPNNPVEGIPSISIDEDGSYKVPNVNDRTGATFDRAVGPGENVTLYAQWKPIYSVSYNANSPTGSYEGDDPDDVVNEYTTTPTTVLDNPYSVEGYRFVGWNTIANPDGDNPGIAFDPENNDSYAVPDPTTNENTFNDVIEPGEVVDLYAQWEKIEYKIHYDDGYEGGTQEMESQTFFFENDVMQSKRNEFTRPGYYFTYFLYTGKDGTVLKVYDPTDFRTILVDPELGPEITLVAQWIALPSGDDGGYVPPLTGIR